MRRFVASSLLIATLSGLAQATEEIPEGTSGYIGVTTNYVNRGVSLTSDHDFYHMTSGMTPDGGMGRMHTTSPVVDDQVFAPALYGGIDYLHASGFYAGLAASTVGIPGSDAFLEADGFAGFKGRFGGAWRWDGGLLVHTYPGEFDFNYGELYGGLGYGPVSGKVWHDPQNDDTYVRATLSFDIGSGLDLDLFAGHYEFKDGPDYDDYGVRVSMAISNWRLGAAVTDTSIDNAIPYAWVAYRFHI